MSIKNDNLLISCLNLIFCLPYGRISVCKDNSLPPPPCLNITSGSNFFGEEFITLEQHLLGEMKVKITKEKTGEHCIALAGTFLFATIDDLHNPILKEFFFWIL